VGLWEWVRMRGGSWGGTLLVDLIWGGELVGTGWVGGWVGGGEGVSLAA